MNDRLRLVSILLVLIVLLAGFGLAVPAVTVNVQGLGSGRGNVFSPASTGTICVPYGYLIYISLFGRWFGPYLLSNISEVYPGNFTASLYTGTNVSVAIYSSSSLISTGTKTLAGTLQVGYYTNVSINPSIDGNQALNSDFHVTVQPPNYTSSSAGIVSLLIQEIGTGKPTGRYNDYVVLAYDGGLYRVYIVFRCYGLLFVPPALSAGGAVSLGPALLILDNGVKPGNDTVPLDFTEGTECPRQELGNLPVVVRESPFIKGIVHKARREVMEKLKEESSASNG